MCTLYRNRLKNCRLPHFSFFFFFYPLQKTQAGQGPAFRIVEPHIFRHGTSLYEQPSFKDLLFFRLPYPRKVFRGELLIPADPEGAQPLLAKQFFINVGNPRFADNRHRLLADAFMGNLRYFHLLRRADIEAGALPLIED